MSWVLAVARITSAWGNSASASNQPRRLYSSACDRNSAISLSNFRRETAGSANCGSDTATANAGLEVQE